MYRFVKSIGWILDNRELFCEAVTEDGFRVKIYKVSPEDIQEGEIHFNMYDDDTPEAIKRYVGKHDKAFFEREELRRKNALTMQGVVEFVDLR